MARDKQHALFIEEGNLQYLRANAAVNFQGPISSNQTLMQMDLMSNSNKAA